MTIPAWLPYPDDPTNVGNDPFTTLVRSEDWASNGSWSVHVIAPGTSVQHDLAAINPDTWTGYHDPAPNGWFSVTPGDSITFQVDALGVHNADYTADAQGVWVGIDLYDSGFAFIEALSGGQDSDEAHVQDGITAFAVTVTGTVPGGAVWAVPYIAFYEGIDYVEAYIDNAKLTACVP